MLNHIPKNISPELIKILMEMGHGDELVLADANYPAVSCATRLIRCDGLAIPELLHSILYLMPIDTYVDSSVQLMNAVPGDDIPRIWDSYRSLLEDSGTSSKTITYLRREDFYERSKKAYAIVATGETSLYANIILKKGVVVE
ncbi:MULTISPECIES: RbsD/FucU family protein [unclassified Streptococcus]|uniref:RbsD/FucU family protein n=1 Tax=unclassified Streptococcus TaxID=2608887 RepID=UPI001072DFF9|nr:MULTISPECIES: RbsD/FucU family protein [unclassified Streptococcus]MBF0787312.1 RbsD/FucU family protein [Streptococcus sp. 19428wC2_LYSM12]MCQ9212651.1 RbsD/FucU family protein [Streptococcus sp. B01]MCQ9213990.1 RbsD/FucU family protein [Streptococcus sp. O1]TFV05799.1 fucose isomerase [Streptococcus sp. LYSM12]